MKARSCKQNRQLESAKNFLPQVSKTIAVALVAQGINLWLSRKVAFRKTVENADSSILKTPDSSMKPVASTQTFKDPLLPGKLDKLSDSLIRTRYDGSKVTLGNGIVTNATLLLSLPKTKPTNKSSLLLLAVLSSLPAGALDDFAEKVLDRDAPPAKGIKGHAKALLGGHLTTGAIKVMGGAISGALVAAANSKRVSSPDTSNSLLLKGIDFIVDTICVAGTSHVANLFDVRPGRALKVMGAASLLTLGSECVTPTILSTTAVALLGDLSRLTMLGDLGAVTIGSAVGANASMEINRVAKIAWAFSVLGLTVMAEKVSFTKVIDDNSILRKIDRLGIETCVRFLGKA